MDISNRINAPTLLTLIRLILSPIMLPFLVVYVLPYNILGVNVFISILFILFSLTDFFDGYLARKYKEETDFGKLLDPVADKFLMCSALVSLLAAGKIYFYWVLLLIGRELFITSLRLIGSENNISINVSWLGKIKTALQSILIAWIIVNPAQGLGLSGIGFWWNIIELCVLALTLFVSLFSAYRYYQLFMAAYIKESLPLEDSPLLEDVSTDDESTDAHDNYLDDIHDV